MALLDDHDIASRLAATPQWRREGAEIVRDLTFADFAGALAFVNRVGAEAEDRNHHPDILLHGWNNVRLSVTNHSAGGLTAADFDLASAIDAFAAA